jgi:muramidase (phage lysozyme)
VFRRLRSRIRANMRRFGYLDGRIFIAGWLVLLALFIGGGIVSYRNIMEPNIDPAVYRPLLDTIAKGESNGNYNAYFGNPGNTSLKFTEMSVSQVLLWQEAYVRQGSASSAVGKYQIIRPTLAGLANRLEIDPEAKFDEQLQDRLGVALLEKRGAEEYMRDQLARDQFAANLAKEWAALPKIHGDNPDQSYYAGDGLNKVQISVEEIYRALAVIKR